MDYVTLPVSYRWVIFMEAYLNTLVHFSSFSIAMEMMTVATRVTNHLSAPMSASITAQPKSSNVATGNALPAPKPAMVVTTVMTDRTKTSLPAVRAASFFPLMPCLRHTILVVVSWSTAYWSTATRRSMYTFIDYPRLTC